MKKVGIVSSSIPFLVALFSLLAFQNCSPEGFLAQHELASEQDSARLSNELAISNGSNSSGSLSHVMYYGYYYGSTLVEEFKDHSNLRFVVSPTGQISSLITQLESAKKNNMTAIVSVQDVFYETKSTGSYRLRPKNEVESQWKLLADAIRGKYEANILSFYIDEPEMYQRILSTKGYNSDYIAELNYIANLIKSSFPATKMQMTSAWADISKDMKLPSSFDIFAFDCYNGWDLCGEQGHHNTRSVPEHLAILKSKVDALNSQDGGQRFLFLVPPTFYRENHPNYPSKALTLEMFSKYIHLAESTQMVKGIMPFLWQSHAPEELVGAREVAEIKKLAKELGQIISKKNITTDPVLSPTITSSGIGCSDNLCIWIKVQNATSSYEVSLKDPTNYAYQIKLDYIKDQMSTTNEPSGELKVTFRIPTSISSIFLARGVEVVFTNISGTTRKTYATKVQPITTTYSWEASNYGACSAKPNYIYGEWSTCGSNSKQTRTAQCSNTSGVQTRTVVCKSATGQTVTDSLCPSQTKPATSSTCSVNCSGIAETSRSCTQTPVIVTPNPAPTITSSGLGCDDNLCIWIKVQNAAATYEIYVRDPANYSAQIKLNYIADKMTATKESSGELKVTFRIPTSAVSIFLNRGGDVVFSNVSGADIKSFATKVNPKK